MVCTMCLLRRINEIRNTFEDLRVDMRKFITWMRSRRS